MISGFPGSLVFSPQSSLYRLVSALFLDSLDLGSLNVQHTLLRGVFASEKSRLWEELCYFLSVSSAFAFRYLVEYFLT